MNVERKGHAADVYSSTVGGMQSSLKRTRFTEHLELQIVLKPSAYIFPM